MTPPQTSSPVKEDSKATRYTFIYKNVEYDATDYLGRHPGGADFIQNMKEERSDLTEYFKYDSSQLRSLHSKQAEKILESFPVVGHTRQSSASVDYMELLRKVEHLYQPIWIMELGIWFMLALMLYVAHTSDIFFVSVIMFAVQQIITGWQSHSDAHSRHPTVTLLGTRFASLLGGFSISWWSPKHNMHHMFTNTKHDGDIQHEYKVYLYPFLYLKWRFDSMEEAIRTRNIIDIVLILVNYSFLYMSGKWVSFLVGMLIGGFYSAFVLIGNHERETRISTHLEGQTFVDHQITTCRNYNTKGFWWLMMMGGMQYQTEHHLFPQIPFYRLPESEGIITEHLEAKGRKICYGPVL